MPKISLGKSTDKYQLLLAAQKDRIGRERMDVVFSILKLAKKIDASCDAELSAFGLSENRLLILFSLLNNEKQNRISDLAKVLDVKVPSVTSLVKRLERDGLVVRERSAHDNREVYVRLLKAGKSVAQEVSALHNTWICDLFGTIPSVRLKEALSILQYLDQGLSIDCETATEARHGSHTYLARKER